MLKSIKADELFEKLGNVNKNNASEHQGKKIALSLL